MLLDGDGVGTVRLRLRLDFGLRLGFWLGTVSMPSRRHIAPSSG